jgi:hypothetical protein
MKTTGLFCALLVLTVLTMPTVFGQSKAASRPMAKTGEEFWVCAYDVKADKRPQYEKFVHTIFWPGAAKLPAKEQQVFRQTRVMHPTKANSDGSYTYAFIMDPVIKGADYDIESLIKKMYGPAKGGEYYKLFEGALKSGNNYHEYVMTQSKD